jgi:hypothetical protein
MTNEIEQFFAADGSLVSIPVKAPKRIAVLNRIAQGFADGTRYSEKEVNEVISRFHDDTAAIRRYMIEYGILERDNKSFYWLRSNKE